jgi:hypothetical protein
MKKFLVASIAAAAILVAQAKADTILFYSFNTNGYTGSLAIPLSAAVTSYVETANIDLNGGSAFSNFNSAGSPLTILSSVSGNPLNHGFSAGNSISQNNWLADGTAYFQFTLNATGYQNLVLSWAENRSSTGPTSIDVQYSTTGVGGTFSDFGAIAVGSNLGLTEDMSSILTLNNNANDVFRLYGVGASAAAGTLKIDNFAVDTIPEPSTMTLIGFGLVGLVAFGRRHVSRK